MKKMLLMCVVVLAAMGAFAADPFPAGGPYKVTVSGIEWTFMVGSDLSASVGTGSWRGTAVPTSTIGDITIPSTLGGRLVTSVGAQAFSSCTSLTSVMIPPIVTSIGDGAFSGCIGLTSVTIPSSVTIIGTSAFSSCRSLTSVTIPSSVVSIGNEAFYECSGLMSVTIPSSITSIGERLFQYCTGMTSVTIPSSVRSVGRQAFYGCDSLMNVMIPSSVTNIEAEAFLGCVGLTSVTMSQGVASIGGSAFLGCDGLTGVTIPSSVTSIGRSAFRGCSGLLSFDVDPGNDNFSSYMGVLFDKAKTILIQYPGGMQGDYTIPSSVTNIGKLAFSDCTGLTSVTIPFGVAIIGDSAFYGCSGLTSVIIPSSLTRIGWGAFMQSDRIQDATVPGWKCGINFAGVTNLVISEGTTSISNSAFSGGCSLKYVKIPSSVTNIEWQAFYGCDSLENLDFEGAPPTGVECSEIKKDTAIRYNGMYYAEWESVVKQCGWTNAKPYAPCPFPEGGPYKETVDGIEWTFMVDADLNASVGPESSSGKAVPTSTSGAITIPTLLGGRSVAGIGDRAFSLCGRLTRVEIPSSVTSIGNSAFSYCSALTSVTIPSSVMSIGKDAFIGCNNIRDATVPGWRCGIDFSSVTNLIVSDGVISIGNRAFADCCGLRSVTIPSSVIDIGDAAFVSCSALMNVTISDGVAIIGASTFCGCSALASVTIPSSVTSIGRWAFADCSALMEICVDAANVNYKSENRMMLTKDGLTVVQGVNGDVEIPAGVMTIGEEAFEGSGGLVSVTIPEGVTRIGPRAFCDCDALTGVTIPSSVTLIEDGTFSGCSALGDITLCDGLRGIESGAFSGCTGLTSVTIPASVTHIGYSAFYECSALATAKILASEMYIDAKAFENCSALSDILFDGDAPTVSKYGAFYGVAEWCRATVYRGTMGWGDGDTWQGLILNWIARPDGGPYKETVDGIEWTFMVDADLNASVGTGSSSGTAVPTSTMGAITIPSLLGGRRVTSIGGYAFKDCTSLTSVVIPSDVTDIGDWAFYNCSSLAGVTIPEGVIRIGGCAFERCAGLTSVVIPSRVAIVGDFAFSKCSGLESVTLSEGVTLIGSNMFSDCTNLTSVTTPSSVRSIGSVAFARCTSLTNVTIPSNVTSIGSYAFSGCSSLTDVTIPSSVTSIGYSVFYGCSGLATVDFEGAPPTGVAGAGFKQDAAIRYNGMYYAEWEPLVKQCDWTKAKPYAPYPFPEGGPYKEKVESIEWTFMVVNGEASVGTGSSGATAVPSKTEGVIAVPTTLGGRAVSRINMYAFYYCIGLTRVTIPEGVTNIDGFAFDGCRGLESVEIPAGVIGIGDYAFSGCSCLAGATIPSSVISIGGYAFEGCAGLKSLLLSEGVVNIGSSAFLGCSGLTNLTIPTSVKHIGQNAFRGCTALTDMVIPSGVTIIERNTFYDCISLLSVTIPPSVSVIGREAFYNCRSLTSITIQPSVTSIGELAFQYCTSLGAIDFEGLPPSGVGNAAIKKDAAIRYNGMYYAQWEPVVTACGWTNAKPYAPVPFPEGGPYKEMVDGIEWTFVVTNGEASVGTGSFSETAIPKATAGDVAIPTELGERTVTGIGQEAFYCCKAITGATIPSSITSIGKSAFCDCSGLTSVTIPSGVTNVDFMAFGCCSGLLSINVEETSPSYASQDGVLFNKAMTMLIQFPGGKQGAYEIPFGVTDIVSGAFCWCEGLEKVTIVPSVVDVGEETFYECSSLASVDFEGTPPARVEYSEINRDAAIRYNAAYQAEWEPVVKVCGWTNAKPYYPFAPATPVISPESGTTFEGSSLSVSMTCASEEATIHYTTDGSEPTMESPVYRRFKVYGKTTVKAIAFFEDGTPSEMAVAEYAKGVCDNPEIAPPDGTVFEHSGQKVSITRYAEDGVVRYTTDGSDPTEDSPAYAGPFTIDETTTIRAKAFGDQYFDSGVVTATLTRVWVKVATPVITAPTSFTGSQQKIEISCATEGATVRYTTNGQDPNSHSPKYTKPFYVTDTTTVKAYATKTDYTKSDIAACTVAKVWGIGDTMGKPDHEFETGGDLGFVRVADETATLGESMKSGEITHEQTSEMSTKVVGPGTLTFKWKTSCEHDEEGKFDWDHAEFWVDGKIKGQLDGETEWIEVSQRIEGDGEHTVIWRYVKDDVEEGGEDCLWVSDYVWETDYTETKTTEVPVPYDWLQEKSRDIVDEYDNYEKVAKQKAYNPRYTVEQCYVAGLDPESTTNEFKMAISMEGGFPTVTWDPDLGVLREYKVWGRESLMSGDWQYPTNSTHHFFKVTVEMK